MKTLYTMYLDEQTGICAKIYPNKIDLFTSGGAKDFVFRNSKPETVALVAKSFLKFIKLMPTPVKVKVKKA